MPRTTAAAHGHRARSSCSHTSRATARVAAHEQLSCALQLARSVEGLRLTCQHRLCPRTACFAARACAKIVSQASKVYWSCFGCIGPHLHAFSAVVNENCACSTCLYSGLVAKRSGACTSAYNVNAKRLPPREDTGGLHSSHSRWRDKARHQCHLAHVRGWTGVRYHRLGCRH